MEGWKPSGLSLYRALVSGILSSPTPLRNTPFPWGSDTGGVGSVFPGGLLPGGPNALLSQCHLLDRRPSLASMEDLWFLRDLGGGKWGPGPTQSKHLGLQKHNKERELQHLKKILSGIPLTHMAHCFSLKRPLLTYANPAPCLEAGGTGASPHSPLSSPLGPRGFL